MFYAIVKCPKSNELNTEKAKEICETCRKWQIEKSNLFCGCRQYGIYCEDILVADYALCRLNKICMSKSQKFIKKIKKVKPKGENLKENLELLFEGEKK